MEKRLFIAIAVTFLFLFLYSRFVTKITPVSQPISSTSSNTTLPAPTDDAPALLSDKTEKEEPLEVQETTIGEFSITYSPRGGYIKKIRDISEKHEFIFQDIGWSSEDKDIEFDTQIIREKMIFTSSQGKTKEYIFNGNTITIKTGTSSPIALFSVSSLTQASAEGRYQEFFYFQEEKIERKGFKNINTASLDHVLFAGAREQYFCCSLLKSEYTISWKKQQKKNKEQEIFLYVLPNKEAPITIYIGPQSQKYLQPYELQGIINYGFFHGIGVLIEKLLYFFHSATKSWGISIMIVAFLFYLVFFPFTMKSTKAMKKMQDMQPFVEELKAKHKDNPQKLNKEIMELYKKHKINPLGGCLPMFFQIPIFFALYQVLPRMYELRGGTFLWIKDLSLPDHAFKLPFPAPFDYINILPIVITILMLLQQKMTTANTNASEQKTMGLIFSLFFGVIFYNFSACLVLYWLVQNGLTFIYQARLSKK